ncbi:hypothetical protein [Wolbachia endosymbiont of Litomosoides brasiliensis]|nr:hypothetical protein [Wolbachia endosymbiont of Litomosoides brasiliensis]
MSIDDSVRAKSIAGAKGVRYGVVTNVENIPQKNCCQLYLHEKI